MPSSVTIAGSTYLLALTGERSWGSNMTNLINALVSQSGKLYAGVSTLTADHSLVTYGLKAPYFKSGSVGTLADAGVVRLINGDTIAWRNQADTDNVTLALGADDVLEAGGIDLVDVSTAQTLTNKTFTAPALTSPVLTTPEINDTSADHQYVFAVNELTDDRTVTLPLLTGNDEFVFKDHTVTLTNKTLVAASNTITTAASGNLTATELNAALAELQGDIDTRVPNSEKAAALGVATLDAGGKLLSGQVPDSFVGALRYVSAWDADTNSPSLSDGSGDEGQYYIVSVAGSTSIDGESDWNIGDWIVANDTTWEKIDNSDKVSSVAGKTGAVTLVSTDITDIQTSTQTLENKTLDASTVGGAANDGTDGYLLLKDQSSDPSAASGDDVKVFAKDKGVYKVDSTGVASEIGSGTGSGELNYISNPSAAIDVTGWAESTDGEVDVSRTTTASELPRENLTPTGIKIVGTGTTAGEYVAYDFNLDDADLSKVLKLQWAQKPLGSYAAGELEVVIRDLDANGGAGEDIIPAITEIPAYTGIFTTTWESNSTSTNFELRIKNPNASATDGIVISDVIVGPGSYAAIPDPRWPSYDESEVTIDLDGTATLNSYTCNFQPYQTSGGLWRTRFNIYMSTNSDGDIDVDVNGATISAGITRQAVAAANYFGSTTAAWRQANNRIEIRGTASTEHQISGDVLLASKPTFATKTGPDVYLAGSVNVDEVAARVYQVSGDPLTSSETVLEWDTVDYDTHGGFSGVDSSSFKYTVPISGKYLINVRLTTTLSASYNGTTERFIGFIYIDGSYLDSNSNYATIIRKVPQPSTSVDSDFGSMTLNLVAGQEIQFKATQNSGDASIVNGHRNGSFFEIIKIPSPQEVANAALTFSEATATRPGLVLNNVVAARAYGTNTTNQDIDGTKRNIGFQTVDYETHTGSITTSNHVTSGSGSATVFTAPVTGYYQFNAAIEANGSLVEDGTIVMSAYKNGSTEIARNYYRAQETDASHYEHFKIGDIVQLDEDETLIVTIEAQSAHNTAVITADASVYMNYLSVHKVGDNQ